MAAQNFEELAQHQGHAVEVVVYGDRLNAAVECVECYEVLFDFDNDEEVKNAS